jgi:uncharacterized protein (DUF58 family)
MIPESVVKELRYIEVYTAKRIRNLRVGNYTSPLRGAGFDFDDHRHYQPGDDIRRLDWNVTARLNAPYVRQTHAERELSVIVAIDVSRSMEYGTADRSKKEVMTFVTGCLLFSALADQINTGFVAFADRVLAYEPPRRVRGTAWKVLEELWKLAPAGGETDVLAAARLMLARLKRTSVVFLVSDFMSSDRLFESSELRTLAARHDCIAVVVQDPGELRLPEGRGSLTLRDMETGRLLHVGLGPAARARYGEVMARHRKRLLDGFFAAGIDPVFVRSDQGFLEPLLQAFLTRRNQ